MRDRVGQQLGDYRLVRFLGQGGFADVYLAEHVHFHTQVAIKVLHTQLGSEDIEKFHQEVHFIRLLKHPHIVQVLDSGIQDGLPFLVMNYAPNGTLHQRHREGSCVPLMTINTYLQQVASALQYAHEHHVIHRDVKPQNMLIGSNDEILLCDFGLAIIFESTSSQNLSQQPGILTYMAPEQFQGKAYPASDQYALAVVAYEWLC